MNKIIKSISVFLIILFSISSVNAKTLTERLKEGHKIRLGFGTSVPWAMAGDNGEPLGFVNMIALTVLEEMGITEYETKVFEWSGLIPGINADRSDMVTGGMYILKSRCANMNFSDPIGVFGDAMLVPKGNPKGINNYADVVRTGAKLVTGAGFNTVEAAKKYGVPESQLMLVEGEVGILAAMKAGRADVAVQTFFGAKEHEAKTNGAFEVTDPKLMPKETLNVVGIGFRKTDVEFKDNFNKALAKVLANPEKMLERAGKYGYDRAQLPPPEMTTEWACSTK
ncbi:transporter substrate-binding domain-containing protein [Candidatus Pelagibacter ubique]|jgi:polar amino acid transport system substrate-binding protein|nr:transporter substrate-binding domain-containing protein [Candidatus Pelagibacter bacterium]MDA8834182.1 transporter substrate-binding domain-containing protein [Candidatus Pelagibacter bacterium]MDC6464368.1 transporter substrate-binding domain-containing protein [Candidatus Pelagibacter ubique]